MASLGWLESEAWGHSGGNHRKTRKANWWRKNNMEQIQMTDEEKKCARKPVRPCLSTFLDLGLLPSCLLFFFFLSWLIYIEGWGREEGRERERVSMNGWGRGRGKQNLKQTLPGSQDPNIMTQAKTNSRVLNRLYYPGAPTASLLSCPWDVKYLCIFFGTQAYLCCLHCLQFIVSQLILHSIYGALDTSLRLLN